MINLDNGPENSSHRTQFMNRIVMFADATGLEIKLVYDPPYHSKYNLIERCWGLLERHWNGTLLNSVETVVEWAGTMTWKGAQPIVRLIETTYDKGVRIAKAPLKPSRADSNATTTSPSTTFSSNLKGSEGPLMAPSQNHESG